MGIPPINVHSTLSLCYVTASKQDGWPEGAILEPACLMLHQNNLIYQGAEWLLVLLQPRGCTPSRSEPPPAGALWQRICRWEAVTGQPPDAHCPAGHSIPVSDQHSRSSFSKPPSSPNWNSRRCDFQSRSLKSIWIASFLQAGFQKGRGK